MCCLGERSGELAASHAIACAYSQWIERRRTCRLPRTVLRTLLNRFDKMSRLRRRRTVVADSSLRPVGASAGSANGVKRTPLSYQDSGLIEDIGCFNRMPWSYHDNTGEGSFGLDGSAAAAASMAARAAAISAVATWIAVAAAAAGVNCSIDGARRTTLSYHEVTPTRSAFGAAAASRRAIVAAPSAFSARLLSQSLTGQSMG